MPYGIEALTSELSHVALTVTFHSLLGSWRYSCNPQSACESVGGSPLCLPPHSAQHAARTPHPTDQPSTEPARCTDRESATASASANKVESRGCKTVPPPPAAPTNCSLHVACSKLELRLRPCGRVRWPWRVGACSGCMSGCISSRGDDGGG